MNPEEERDFNALMAYKRRFGDENFPGVDSLPVQYREIGQLAPLLEQCVREGKPLEALVEVREDDPNVLY